MTKDEALAFDLALEALREDRAWLESDAPIEIWDKNDEAITAIKQVRSAPVQDSTCSETLRAQGKAYPRTCRKCGKGPCIALVNAALDKKAENARELGLDYEPAEVLGHNGWGFPIKAAAPVQEDWGPGPHECHSLTAAPVQEPAAWRYRGILHDFDPSDWAEGPVTPLYTTPPAQPAPVQEPVAYRSRMRNRDGQVITGWVVHTDTSENPDPRIEIEPLYTTPPAAQRQWVEVEQIKWEGDKLIAKLKENT